MGDSKELENFWGALSLHLSKSELSDTYCPCSSVVSPYSGLTGVRGGLPCGPELLLDMQSVSEMAELTLRFANNATAEELRHRFGRKIGRTYFSMKSVNMWSKENFCLVGDSFPEDCRPN